MRNLDSIVSSEPPTLKSKIRFFLSDLLKTDPDSVLFWKGVKEINMSTIQSVAKRLKRKKYKKS